MNNPENGAFTRLWYAVRYSVLYYNLSHFPKIYEQFSPKGFRLNSHHTSVNPFFIMACGRSGNTLLRAILCKNPQISIPPESYILRDVYDKFRIFNRLRWDTVVKLVLGEFEAQKDFKDWRIDLQPLYPELLSLPGEKRTLEKIVDSIYQLYSKKYFPEATIWGDKTPGNNLWISKIRKMFPAAKFIFLYRDGRDVSASFLKSGMFNDLEKAARFWNLNMKLSENAIKLLNSDQHVTVHYEELVDNPDNQIRILCRFLGVEFSPEMLEPYTLFDKLGDVPAHNHHSNLINPINNKSVGKWKEVFSHDQQQLAHRLMKHYLQKYGYMES